MTFPLPWVPRPGLRSSLSASDRGVLVRWLLAPRTTFDTVCLPQIDGDAIWRDWAAPEPDELSMSYTKRCFRMWANRRNLYAYDEVTGEIVAAVPTNRVPRPFTGDRIPSCSC